uniref:Uncharacterized protein n=1 Tax=Arcella intermedia TaxID=1963864 RepID=A0A6B2LQU6_9EUKA
MSDPEGDMGDSGLMHALRRHRHDDDDDWHHRSHRRSLVEEGPIMQKRFWRVDAGAHYRRGHRFFDDHRRFRYHDDDDRRRW